MTTPAQPDGTAELDALRDEFAEALAAERADAARRLDEQRREFAEALAAEQDAAARADAAAGERERALQARVDDAEQALLRARDERGRIATELDEMRTQLAEVAADRVGADEAAARERSRADDLRRRARDELAAVADGEQALATALAAAEQARAELATRLQAAERGLTTDDTPA
ncbi:hypothetical protein SAMN05443575_1965 [Jatrophihabitans endophyticus]|uniref:Uncharacterized protein n=1 Tax=Jatrophihabitans endophyticus TaxID=1206085 RepID=A0A1M5IPL4_9ACTN|nr:hypothetical protein [Jatrophihabitans endophyticus]SHG30268.1 hypothetical protein SAMN05443575_1965 [Jatrophihabitans endophyticus]